MRIKPIHQLILKSVGSTEETTFNEFCQALQTDKPSEKSQWRELFQAIDQMEKEELIEVERTNGKIDTLILTPSGAMLAR